MERTVTDLLVVHVVKIIYQSGLTNEFKNTYVVESWLIVYFKKEKHGDIGGQST
jgi:hypothetical protein